METANKLRVAVFMGGNSNEKEISIDSARNIVYKLSPHKYEVTPVFVTLSMELYKVTNAQLVYNSTQEIADALIATNKIRWSDLPQHFDFIFLGMHGGLAENGGLQGAFETLGLAYNGSSVLASALCMDKFKSMKFLQSLGFDVPNSILVSKDEWTKHQAQAIARITAQFPFPFIVKPHDDGCSVMVQKVTSNDDLVASIDAILANKKEFALVQEFISGMELTVGVIGNDNPQALPPSYALASGNVLTIQEKFLPGGGENQTPAPLPEATLHWIQQTMERAYAVVGCKGYARIDCFYQSAEQSPTGKERVIFLEFNTLPGLTAATCLFHQAAEVGMKPMDLIDLIVKYGLEEHGHRKQLLAVTPIAKENVVQQTA